MVGAAEKDLRRQRLEGESEQAQVRANYYKDLLENQLRISTEIVAEQRETFATWFCDFDDDGRADIFVSGYSAESMQDVGELIGTTIPCGTASPIS